MKIDIATMRSAIEAGLPVHKRWIIRGTPLDYDFSVARSGLGKLPTGNGGSQDQEWSDFCAFGKYDYAEGGGAAPWLCIRMTDGAVCGLDFEQEDPVFLLDSSLQRFIQTFSVFDDYLGSRASLPADFDARLRRIDPNAYPVSDWRLLFEAVAENKMCN